MNMELPSCVIHGQVDKCIILCFILLYMLNIIVVVFLPFLLS